MTRATVCPRCHQDHLRSWILKPTGEQILLCPECEATWLGGTAPTMSTFTDYEAFLAARDSITTSTGCGQYRDRAQL